MNNFNSLMIKLLKIQKPELYISELARGTKPGKAARKAMPTCAPEVLEVFGSAKLAVTVYEINEAYNTPVKSCMTGKPVGDYYSKNGIGVIWTNNFRILVRLKDMQPVVRAYGFHGHLVDKFIRELGGKQFIDIDELCAQYPLIGRSYEFSPYLDWHSCNYSSKEEYEEYMRCYEYEEIEEEPPVQVEPAQPTFTTLGEMLRHYHPEIVDNSVADTWGTI